MPATRPSDKGHDNAEWWKDDTQEQMEGEGAVPEGPTANNKDGSGKRKFDEEMEPVKHPV
jgi:hypothetical protein